MVYFTEISSHPDQSVTVTLRPAIPISLRETPNAVKLRFLSVPTLKNRERIAEVSRDNAKPGR